MRREWRSVSVGVGVVIALLAGGLVAVMLWPGGHGSRPYGVDHDGRPNPALRSAVESFSAALTTGDEAALRRMSGDGEDVVAALVRDYGGHPARVAEYAEDAAGFPSVHFIVDCGGRPAVNFWQVFEWHDGDRYSPVLGAADVPAGPPSAVASPPQPPPPTC